MSTPVEVRLPTEPFDPGEVVSLLAGQNVGGVALFTGFVKGEEAGRPIDYLEFKPELGEAEEALRRLGEEIAARWPELTGVAIFHRVGRAMVGEVLAALGVAAATRRVTFSALAWGMDKLKEIVANWVIEIGWKEGEGHEP